MNKLVGFTYNKDDKTSSYIYRRNLQGDIIGIYDSLGNEVGGYAYDAYGKCYVKYKDNSSEEEKTILNTNPFRYRGYYYDNETGLYYLNARYYDPSIGRFISLDVLSILDETKSQINGLNLYMYCNNNPIMYVDPSGHFAFSTLLIGLAVSFLVTWGLSEIFGEQLIGGIGSIVNGGSAILTSMSLFAFGPIGWMIGGIGIIAGLASIAFGTAEIQESTGYGNWIKDIGVTKELYSNLYVGSNIISSLVTIFGNVYRNSRILSGNWR